MPEPAASTTPRHTLTTWDAAAFLVGIVIGAGIFRLPPLVAANVGSEAVYIGIWALGGVVMLVGAFCYAELGSAQPDAGGEYNFLSRAYDRPLAVLFGWARGTVIQTGAIAYVAFVYGEYASVLLPLGPYGTAIHAAVAILALTAVNLVGTPQSRLLQLLLTLLTIAALLAVVAVGLSSYGAGGGSASSPSAAGPSAGALGLALVFVLYAYGGWNEAAYLSGEIRDVQRNMARALLIGTGAIVALYLLANLAYLAAFGLQGLRETKAVGADLMRVVLGDRGAIVFSLIVCICTLSTTNATIFTGARTYTALGRDLAVARSLGNWEARGHKPTNALILQCVISLALVAFGAVTHDGIEKMVAYTAPVFWFFLLLVAMSVLVFRRHAPDSLRYRMPLYPLPPILLAVAAVWMLYSSLAYAGPGAMLGIAVLLLGTPLLLLRPPASEGAE
jgi:amino acid transporter